MATPHVTGTAALILQANPTINPGSLKEVLKTTAETAPSIPGMRTNPFVSPLDPKFDIGSGDGLIDAFAAVTRATTTDVKFPSCLDVATSPVPGVAPVVPGGICLLSLNDATPPRWLNTSDLRVASDPPVIGVPNTILVSVKNAGPAGATFKVSIGIYMFTAGTAQFYHLGTQSVTLGAGATTTVSQPWTPLAGFDLHRCLQASINFANDTNYANNVTQRNIDVKATASPAVFTFNVENPLSSGAVIELNTMVDNPNWTCTLDKPQVNLHPFTDCPEPVTATLNPVPSAATPPPTTNGRTLLGGVSVQAIDTHGSAGTGTCHVYAFAKPCDVNNDGFVDRNDIALMLSLRRDLYTVNDARVCVQFCDKPLCAPAQ
jgi:hypothetical protein